ncbi:MAG: hypothetical protein HGB29_05650 [Chlorobiaceae bacterium]|nr:hypothetical protein [Chlorobiaceae bacterium]NTW74332.1 hypothetical protein [Chlorobiaceae bacterium]
MTTANEHIRNIQERIDELEQTISDRGQQIRDRTSQLREEMQKEIAPEELIKKHPFEATGGALVVGWLIGKVVRSLVSPGPRVQAPAPSPESSGSRRMPTAVKAALATVGTEALLAGEDLAISWIKNYISERKKKPA